MRNTAIQFILLFSLFVHKSSWNPNPNQYPPVLAQIEGYIQQQVSRHKIPGLAVAVIHGDDIVYQQGFGSTGNGQKVTPETPFFIGSLSKSITAMAVMQLVDEGELVLDLPAQYYLPWFHTADPQSSANITVRHLLNQTSGFTRSDQPKTLLAPDASIEQAVRLLSSARPSAQPGRQYAYFNPNYTVLGVLIEAVSGLSYQQYIEQNIFAPLEMSHSFTSEKEGYQKGLAKGFNSLFGFPIAREQPFLEYDIPAGFIISSAKDMANLLKVQMNSGHFGHLSVLSPESVFTMQSPPQDLESAYAMGWEIGLLEGEPVISHSGSLETFYSRAVMLPERQFGFVVLINQNGLLNMAVYESITDNIARLLIGLTPQSVLPMRTIQGLMALIVLTDLTRHIFSIMRHSRWSQNIKTENLSKIKKRVRINLLASAGIIVLLPGIFILLLGLDAARVLFLYFLPEVSIWLLCGSALSILDQSLKLKTLKRIII